MLISNTRNFAIFKQPPCRRIIKYEGIYGSLKPSTYFLSFPHIIFKFHYFKSNGIFKWEDNLKVAFSNKSGDIYYPPLPNIDQNLYSCILINNDFNSQSASNLEDLCEKVVSRFWSASFNPQWQGSRNKYQNTLLFDFDKWQEKTKKFPKWIPKKLIKYNGKI